MKPPWSGWRGPWVRSVPYETAVSSCGEPGHGFASPSFDGCAIGKEPLACSCPVTQEGCHAGLTREFAENSQFYDRCP